MEPLTLFLVAFCVLGFGAVSGRIRGGVLTLPMAFAAVGLALGRVGAGQIALAPTDEIVRSLAELTLILVLFTDATRIDLRSLFREHTIPVRLLGIGLPLTIVAGVPVAVWLFHGALSLWEAAVLATILAPTDAALGQAVVSDERVPIRIRQALNVESGLNDGICLPILLIVIAIAAGLDPEDASSRTTVGWAQFAVLQVVLGPLIGFGVGGLSGRVIAWTTRQGWMDGSFQRISSLAVAVLAYASAEACGGNGFIAAFCAGLALGNVARDACTSLYEFAEAEGQLLTLLIFLLFGAVMAPSAFEAGWRPWVYAALSLTIVRLIPVGLALIGLRLRWDTVVFLGWFGPRGVASILYVLLVLDESRITGGSLIGSTVSATVLLSILAHGLTAAPAARLYAERIGCADPVRTTEERRHVTPMPLRHPGPKSG